MGYHFREQDSFVRIVELTPAMRKQIEATIEHLLSVLDHFDGDENLEDDDPAEEGGDDEPSLGWAEMQARFNQYGAADMHNWFLGYDRELDTADEEDGGDSEPTLGAPERHPASWEFAPFGVICREPGMVRHVREKSQEHWADGLPGDHEREEENEHGGDILDECHDGDADDEPSLGWLLRGSQDAPEFMASGMFVDGEEDAGDMPEWDIAEHGVADSDALHDPEITFASDIFGFDGSGRRAARQLLKKACTAFPRHGEYPHTV